MRDFLQLRRDPGRNVILLTLKPSLTRRGSDTILVFVIAFMIDAMTSGQRLDSSDLRLKV